MYDPVTLDQLRAFVTVVEEGSFSAAARKLKRVQSAISTSMANLEAQLGVRDLGPHAPRSRRSPTQGEAVLGAARRVLRRGRRARDASRPAWSVGVEAAGLAVRRRALPRAGAGRPVPGFAQQFPDVDLRIDTQVMSAVSATRARAAPHPRRGQPAGLAPGPRAQALVRDPHDAGGQPPPPARGASRAASRASASPTPSRSCSRERSADAGRRRSGACSRRARGASRTCTPSTRCSAPVSAGATSPSTSCATTCAPESSWSSARGLGRRRAHAPPLRDLPQRHDARPRAPLGPRTTPGALHARHHRRAAPDEAHALTSE